MYCERKRGEFAKFPLISLKVNSIWRTVIGKGLLNAIQIQGCYPIWKIKHQRINPKVKFYLAALAVLLFISGTLNVHLEACSLWTGGLRCSSQHKAFIQATFDQIEVQESETKGNLRLICSGEHYEYRCLTLITPILGRRFFGGGGSDAVKNWIHFLGLYCKKSIRSNDFVQSEWDKKATQAAITHKLGLKVCAVYVGLFMENRYSRSLQSRWF